MKQKYHALFITPGNTLICKEFDSQKDLDAYAKFNREETLVRVIFGLTLK